MWWFASAFLKALVSAMETTLDGKWFHNGMMAGKKENLYASVFECNWMSDCECEWRN